MRDAVPSFLLFVNACAAMCSLQCDGLNYDVLGMEAYSHANAILRKEKTETTRIERSLCFVPRNSDVTADSSMWDSLEQEVMALGYDTLKNFAKKCHRIANCNEDKVKGFSAFALLREIVSLIKRSQIYRPS